MSERRRGFERLFTDDADPWRFDTSRYEHDKREATMRALGQCRFGRAVEIGCATGALTAQLATVCDELLGLDLSETALAHARARLAETPNVRLMRGEGPGDWPEGTWDLMVFSEVLYFLSAEEIAEVSRLAHRTLDAQGMCLLVNWTGPNDLPVDGRHAVEIFRTAAPWAQNETRPAPRYRIDRFTGS